MVFSSFTFLVYFLPFTFLIYFLLPHKFRNLFLLVMSLIFYMWGSPQFLLVMVAVIIINFIFGILIDKADVKSDFSRKKKLLFFGILVNILVLFVFKYLAFSINNINNFLTGLGMDGWSVMKIALPVGISFYIFQSMSYLIDVYRHDAPVQKNLKNLALYVSMFPQLVAGPIVRYNSIVADVEKERNVTLNIFILGLQIFIIGLVKKVLIANNMAILADGVFTQPAQYLSAFNAWLGAISYTLQIYFDFSGYSDMAVGLGLMLGFKFPMNFNYPYISASITEFWRRWHISLSSWFKDYLYIPLGGSHVKVPRMYVNLFIVFAVTGLWHGANWTFLIWGLFHGTFLVLEKLTGFHKIERLRILRWATTMLVVVIGWVIFRSDSIHYALLYLRAMFGLSNSGIYLLDLSIIFDKWSLVVIFLGAFIGATPIIKKTLMRGIDAFIPEKVWTPLAITQKLILSVLFVVVLIFMANSSYNPFIYFRF